MLICCILQVPFILEQPGSSLLEFHPDFQRLCKWFRIYRVPQPNYDSKNPNNSKTEVPAIVTAPAIVLLGICVGWIVWRRKFLTCSESPWPSQQNLCSPGVGIEHSFGSTCSTMKQHLCESTTPLTLNKRTPLWFLRSKANYPVFELCLGPESLFASSEECGVERRDELQAPWDREWVPQRNQPKMGVDIMGSIYIYIYLFVYVFIQIHVVRWKNQYV